MFNSYFFFIAHAYSAFENNTFILQRASELEEIEINSQNFFQAFSYHGVWNHSYKIGNLSVMDEASLTSTYDSDSGILLKMAIEMISTQQLIGPISQEINVDAIGSFKISLVLPSNHTTDILPFFLGVFSLIVIVEKQGRSK